MDSELFALTLGTLVVGGIITLLILIVQMLIGFRKIHFKGRLHLRVHKWVGWALLASAVIHGLGAIVYVRGV